WTSTAYRSLACSAPRLVRRVVHLGRVPEADRKTEASNRGVRAHWPQAVHSIRRDVHEIPLHNLPFFTRNRHQAPAADNIIELMCGVLVRVHRAAAFHLELADEFEVSAQRRGLHLSRPVQPPDGNRPLMLRGRGYPFNRAHVHDRPPPGFAAQPRRARATDLRHARARLTADRMSTSRTLAWRSRRNRSRSPWSRV